MASLGISEFTFGYAFLYEQTRRNWADLQAVPILPSLQQENDLGWDAKLPLTGTTYYFQFKLAEYLTRANAKHIKDGTYGSGYYRVYLHKHGNNNQHRSLRKLCQACAETYYVAPETADLTTFNQAYLAERLTDQTRLIPLIECDDIIDGEQHYFTYESGDIAWTQWSQAKRHGKSTLGRDLEKQFRSSRDKWRELDRGFAAGLFQQASEAARELIDESRPVQVRPLLPLLDFDPGGHTRAETLSRTSQVLAAFFGVIPLVVGERAP